MTRRTPALFPCLILLALASLPRLAEARDVQTLRTPGGIDLWLVEARDLPIVALRFAVRGGSLEDPPGKEGVGDLVAALLDQGAGPLDAAAFQGRLDALGSRLSLSVSRAAFSGGFVCVSRHLAATAELLRLAVAEPQFRPADVERARRQKIVEIAQDEHDPDRRALQIFYQTAFAGHPYARPVWGTAQTLQQLTQADIVAQSGKLLRRRGLHVVIVGALTVQEAAALVDMIFGGLPEGTPPSAPPRAQPALVAADVPASGGQAVETAVFALPMPDAGDPEYFATLALTHILGSGNFDARLTQELREKRGLTYAVSTELISDPAVSFLLGAVSTRPGRMDEALTVIRETLATLRRDGPGERELANAKSSLNGSYVISTVGVANLADHLLGLWLSGLGASYSQERKAGIDAISIDAARQAASAYFNPGGIRVLILRPADGN